MVYVFEALGANFAIEDRHPMRPKYQEALGVKMTLPGRE
jgi:hypothetical protein